MLPLPQHERRKYYRISDTTAIEYQLLSAKEYEAEKKFFRDQPSGLRNLKNKYANFVPNELDVENFGGGDVDTLRGLLKLIININEKVDLILSYLEKKEDVSLYQKAPQKITLSAEGIGFFISECIPVGSCMKLRVLLPQSPKILITTLGKVVRITPKNVRGMKKFEVGVAFLDIHEDDQEAIIKYIFMRQRDMLRNKSGS